MHKEKGIIRYIVIILVLMITLSTIFILRSMGNELAYNYQIMHIEPNTKFLLHFRSAVDPNKAYSVYTDKSCNVNSLVYTKSEAYYTGSDKMANGVDIIIYPPEYYILSKHIGWDSINEYYIRVYYDQEATTPTLLDIPKTYVINSYSDVETITAEISVNDDGLLTLTCDEDSIAGIDYVEVYNLPLIKDAETISESGYIGEATQLFTIDVSNDNEGSFVFDSKNYIEYTDGYVSAQNVYNIDNLLLHGVCGEKCSLLSKELNVKKLKSELPWKLSNSTERKFTSTLEELPKTVDVQMMDNTLKPYPINYNLIDDSSFRKSGFVTYEYSIPGTLLSGKINFSPGKEKYHGKVINQEDTVSKTVIANRDSVKSDKTYYITKEDYLTKRYNLNSKLYYTESAVERIEDLYKAKEITGEFQANPLDINIVNYNSHSNDLKKRFDTLGDIFTVKLDSANNEDMLSEVLMEYGSHFSDRYWWEIELLRSDDITMLIILP